MSETLATEIFAASEICCGLVCVLYPHRRRSFLFITYVDMFSCDEDARKGAEL